MGVDYKAPAFWAKERLAAVASDHRQMSSYAHLPNFDVIRFVENDLPTIMGNRIRLEIKDLAGTRDYPAYVPAGSLRLVCDDEVWQHAKLGDSESKFILAHECGHLFLHNGYDLHFSDPRNRLSSYIREEDSTEWQANTYAEYLLLPDLLVQQFKDASELAQICDVPMWLALKRFEDVHPRRFSGEVCRTCYSIGLKPNGANFKCETCGSVTVCR